MMKRAVLLMLALCLVLSVSALGQDEDAGLKGKMFVSGYGGYTIGMGDAFFDETIAGIDVSFKAGISFGGAFHYGVTEKLLIGGELGLQSYKSEASFGGISASETETKMNILASGLYALNYVEDEQAFFLAFGVGQYAGWDEFGFNAGVLYAKKMGEKLSVFVMPRIHYVMSDPDAAMMVQVAVGVTFPLGG
ncbi:MAG: hypothetical protein KAW61_06300 [candidate division Zixibacteria bacterium]|nr:hypothetical protein [candidate division Zixibacteria bacterium]